ncbi:hypothetical protein [Actinomadura monticuli]|uniref:SDR family oxidoreductase n=1 Tax=Actinomadura monticuli TaxID=3097367 RepID=A0ABV4Q648_9ACTN
MTSRIPYTNEQTGATDDRTDNGPAIERATSPAPTWSSTEDSPKPVNRLQPASRGAISPTEKTLFTAQKALPLINDNGSIFMTGPTPPSAPSPAGASTREARRSSRSQGRNRVPDPRGKMSRPEENATAALFLTSDDSSYVNGLELLTDAAPTAI